jgi:MFS family permease
MLTFTRSWRWCFYINLPPGALVAIEVAKDLHNKLDFVGFFLFAPCITMLLLAVQWGGNE